MSHSFENTNFSRPTYCDHCQGLLWGFVKQGLCCSSCGAVCHHDCQKDISKCKNAAVVATTISTENEGSSSPQPIAKRSYTDSPAAKSLRTLQQQHSSGSLDHTSSSSSSLDTNSTISKLKHIATSEEFQNVIVSAAIHSTDSTQPVNDYLANLPPLNPQKTAKNFSRFVSRCGPMFTFRDNLILLLSWNKPIDTMVALLLYCLVCLHPKLILLIPHVILLQIIISGYNKKYNNLSNDNKGNQDLGQQGPSPFKISSAGTAKRTTATTSRFSAFFPVAFDETSPEYVKNLQNLQNLMGEMSDLYDLCASNAHHVDWSSETETMHIFQFALISFAALSLIIWLIPLHILFLVSGVGLFLLNTRFAKYILKEMLPHVTKMGQSQMHSAAQWYAQIEKRLDDQANFKELSLYENQRWWSGSGFIPHMLPEERALWSNFSGSIELAPKEELPAPNGYHWIEDNWSLDKTGPWMDDHLGLEVMVYPENGGWVYTDNNWENPRNKSNNSNNALDTSSIHTANTITTVPTTPKDKSVTRRRRWVRKCELDFK